MPCSSQSLLVSINCNVERLCNLAMLGMGKSCTQGSHLLNSSAWDFSTVMQDKNPHSELYTYSQLPIIFLNYIQLLAG